MKSQRLIRTLRITKYVIHAVLARKTNSCYHLKDLKLELKVNSVPTSQ
jgi:hypothetical protein